MSFCKIDNFVLYDLVIFFYLNSIYQGCQASASLLLNVSDVFFEKQMSNRNRILTVSKCFPSLLQPLLINAKSPKDVDVNDNDIENADVGGICIKGVCIKGTQTKSACIIDTCPRGAGVGVVYIEGVYTSNTYAKSTCARNAF